MAVCPVADSVQDFRHQDSWIRPGSSRIPRLGGRANGALGNPTDSHCNPITRKAPPFLHRRSVGSPCRDKKSFALMHRFQLQFPMHKVSGQRTIAAGCNQFTWRSHPTAPRCCHTPTASNLYTMNNNDRQTEKTKKATRIPDREELYRTDNSPENCLG